MASPKMVRESELDFDSDLVFTLDGEPFTGIAYEETTSGRSEVHYKDGRQDGVARDWYPSGQLKTEAVYVLGVQHGLARHFNEDGRLTSDVLYEYGIRTLARRYSAAGDPEVTEVLDRNSGNWRLLERYRREFHWGVPRDAAGDPS